MVKKTATFKSIDPSRYHLFLDKADEFHFLMTIAIRERKWKGAALNGIHCMISACDAVLAKKASIKSTSQNHSDSANLLKQCYRSDSTTAAQIR